MEEAYLRGQLYPSSMSLLEGIRESKGLEEFKGD